MELYVIRRRSAFADVRELETVAPRSARIGDEEMPDRVRWIRSYVMNEPDGRIRTASTKRKTPNRSASTPAALEWAATKSARF
jgi:hypothetical protein